MTDVKLGLIGDNIARSSAPLLHRLAGRLAGLAVQYDRLNPRELGRDFDAVLKACAAGGYRGINVTYPYKEHAARRVRIDDPMVRAVGAVNTVTFEADGPRGHNTDHTGFIAAYRQVLGTRPPGVVCLIGAGGVGRAVAFALAALGAEELRLVERDLARAEALAEALRASAPALTLGASGEAAAARGAQGLVNCTPVGMVGHEGTPLERRLMAGAEWAFDAVYTPVETRFLGDARAEGLAIISGYELFFHQGVEAWEIFTGRPVDHGALRRALAGAA